MGYRTCHFSSLDIQGFLAEVAMGTTEIFKCPSISRYTVMMIVPPYNRQRSSVNVIGKVLFQVQGKSSPGMNFGVI